MGYLSYRHNLNTFRVKIMNLDLNLLKDKFIKEKFFQIDNIEFSSEQLTNIALSLGSGKLWENPPIYGRKIYNSSIVEVKATNDKSTLGVGLVWHNDGTYMNKVPLGNILHITQAPSKGGPTQFTDASDVLDRLPYTLYNEIKNMFAYHDYNRSQKISRRYDRSPDYELKRVTHPVILNHPLTNHEVLFVNRLFTHEILNCSRHESTSILKNLFKYFYDEKYIKTLRANTNSILIWDNIGTQHRAINDYFPETRIGYRVSFY